MVVKSVDKKAFELAENPLWLESENAFFWVDIENGNIYKYCLNLAKIECVLSTQYRIGAFVFDAFDNLILLSEKGLIRAYKKDNKYVLESDYLHYFPLENERFNDAICDVKGRIIAGIKRDDNSEKGRVVIFEKNKVPRVLISNVKISNGMGFSNDNLNFFHTDSLEKEIYKYHYNAENGTISDKKVVYINKTFGVPDGMTIDRDDNILTCIWGEGRVLKISPNTANILDVIYLPCKLSSSLTFGGNNFEKLLLTSAYISLDEEEKIDKDGLIYIIDDFDFGKKEYKAKI